MSDSFFTPNISSYNRPFWEGGKELKLKIQHCSKCQEYTYPPRVSCPECLSELEWVDAQGEGTIYSYGVIHHPEPPGSVDKANIPIIGAVVELEEGPRMVTNIVHAEVEEIEIGDSVTVTFEAYGDDMYIPQFELCE